MRDLKLNKKYCLNSISFSILGVIIFISEFISIVMNILLLIITNWNFLKKTIKILNIVCLSIIVLTTIINIIMFCSFKNIKKEIFQKYTGKMVSTVFLILFYIIIIIFNIYNAIYISLHLHIADYPEYGGRKRDQEYIDSHPKEFGNVSLKEFIIVAVCPSIICVFNALCIIICILIRYKIILIHNKAFEKYNVKYTKKDKDKDKEKHKNNKKNKRNSVNNIKSTDELFNINNTDPINNNNIKGKNEIIKIKINNSEDGGEYVLNLPKRFIKLDSADNLNNEENNEENNENQKEYNEELPDKFFFGGREVKLNDDNKNKEYSLTNPQKIIINSMQGTKSTINYQKNK